MPASDIYLQMANNFCRFLSNGYRFKTVGTDITYAPCCWYKKEISIFDPNFALRKQKISAVSDWIPECSACQQIEDSGVYNERSPRMRSFFEIPNESVPDNVPAWLELSIDDTCNAACVICGPWHSTTWQKQEVKFGIKNALPDKTSALELLTAIQKKFPLEHVRSVSFLGGEPFLSPIPLEVCRALSAINGSLEQISVHFQTNGSVMPDPELLTLLQPCAMVRFNFSIDGTETRFEYLRYPLQWAKIQSVIQQMKNIAWHNAYYTVLATLNPLNCFYYDEIESWAKQTFDTVQFRSMRPNRSIGRMDLAYTPIALREECKQKYGENHAVSKMFSNLESLEPSAFMAYVSWLDVQRKNSWQQAFPEICKFFQ